MKIPSFLVRKLVLHIMTHNGRQGRDLVHNVKSSNEFFSVRVRQTWSGNLVNLVVLIKVDSTWLGSNVFGTIINILSNFV